MTTFTKPIPWCKTHKCKLIAISPFELICPKAETGVKEGGKYPLPCKHVYLMIGNARVV